MVLVISMLSITFLGINTQEICKPGISMSGHSHARDCPAEDLHTGYLHVEVNLLAEDYHAGDFRAGGLSYLGIGFEKGAFGKRNIPRIGLLKDKNSGD